jgi:osmoprotectant transport system substrate-binding protein
MKLLVAIAVACTAIVGPIALGAPAAGAAGPVLIVGAKNFDGAQALSQAYGQGLEAKGDDITFVNDIGPTEVVFPKLVSGEIDAYADYQGTLLAYLGATPTASRAENFRVLQSKLQGTGIVAGEPAPAVDKNGFYVTVKTAHKYHLSKVSDLTALAPKLVIGAPPECEERPLCLGADSQNLYHLTFKEVRKLDAGGPATARALTRGKVDVAVLFTGSSVIPAGAVLLRDDKGLQPADNPVLLLRESKATQSTMRTVRAISTRLTTAAYNRMSVDLAKGVDPSDVAAAFLERNHLG